MANTESFKEFSDAEIEQQLSVISKKPRDPMLFFSSQWGGFTRNPRWFQVPVEDHGFHRGDGVFEAIKSTNGRPYLLKEHVDRLGRSASAIGLKLPMSGDQICALVERGVGLLNEPEALVRIFATRGPGGFSVNPLDCPESMLYVAFAKRKDLPKEKYEVGVRLGFSEVPWKPGFFSTVKSLNYLPNVLMKAEANQRGVDFMVGVHPDGFLTEGPTENLVILRKDQVLCHPPLNTILKGCTMVRLFDLVEQKGLLKVDRQARLSKADLKEALEVYFVGTTLDVLPVTDIDGLVKPRGPWSARLLELLKADQIKR